MIWAVWILCGNVHRSGLGTAEGIFGFNLPNTKMWRARAKSWLSFFQGYNNTDGPWYLSQVMRNGEMVEDED